MLNNTRKIKAVEITGENTAYQVPKWLIHNEAYKTLGSEAKILYAIMRDRSKPFLENCYIDEKGYMYIVYTRQDMMKDVCLSDKSVTKAIKSLIAHGLIDEVRVGNNKPNRIYVLKETR